MLRHLLALALYLPLLAVAAGLEPITSETACYPEHGAGEFGWMLISGDTSRPETCVFAEFPQGEAAVPFVRSGGVDIKLQLTLKRDSLKGRWQTEETFVDPHSSLRVRLRHRLTRDSCPEVRDGCCGQEYEGLLEMADGKEMRSYKVKRWSGS